MSRCAVLRVSVSSLAIVMSSLTATGAAFAQSVASPAPVGPGDSASSSPSTTSATAAPGGAAAVAPVPSRPAAPGDSYTVNTVVVTAQKRSQNLQDVPIVVTVVNKQLLQDSGVKDIKDLSKLTPGLTVTSTASEADTTARIRGVGTVGNNPGLESSVGVVIDGVYRPRNGVGFGDLGDVDQIEVLKGPQSPSGKLESSLKGLRLFA